MENNSLKTRIIDGVEQVYDPVRHRYVKITPEEWVRQQTILYLHHNCHYPYELMCVEGSISINGMSRRCDIIVYGHDASPRMIVECKKEDIKINQKVVDQACRYNIALHVPYLLLTNGLQQVCLKVDFTNLQLQQIAIPHWDSLT